MMKNDWISILFPEICKFAVYFPISCALLYFCNIEISWTSLGIMLITMLMYRFMTIFVNPNYTISMSILSILITATLGLDIINNRLHLDPIKYLVTIMMMFLVAYGMWRFDINRDEEKRKKVK